jgi:hypothetical protein
MNIHAFEISLNYIVKLFKFVMRIILIKKEE